MMRTCPCCLGPACSHLFDTPPMPVGSAVLIQDADQARAMVRQVMSMWHCADCGYLWNAGFDESLVRYDADYEGTQAHSPHFRAYLAGLAARWAARWPDARRLIEVGCGQGEFLAELAQHCRAEMIGYDPAARGESAGRGRIVASLLPPAPEAPDALADVVLSRMTLEHVAWPADFLRAKLGWLRPGGVLAVQVPDAAPTIAQAHLCELQYEHVGYFGHSALGALLARSGLRGIDWHSDYGGQHLSALARRALPGHGAGRSDAPGPVAAPPSPQALVRAQAGFGAAWDRRLRAQVLAGRRVLLLGAGSRATALGANLPDPALVAGVIDINPARAGSHVPGTGWRTDLPETLANPPASGRDLCVVVMNPVYASEIAARLAALGAQAELLFVQAGPG